jgi:hypothetical protein
VVQLKNVYWISLESLVIVFKVVNIVMKFK